MRNGAVYAVKAAVTAAVDDAKATTLFKDQSGALRKSITGTSFGLEGSVTADAGVAKFIENGTRPHVIEARGSGTLAFVANGSTVFARRVNHPGTAPRPFMEHAKQVGEQTLDYGIELLLEKPIARFNAA
jgi:hypothetical protein